MQPYFSTPLVLFSFHQQTEVDQLAQPYLIGITGIFKILSVTGNNQ
jgi:hypothetical protein